jgi:hypothetical protein
MRCLKASEVKMHAWSAKQLGLMVCGMRLIERSQQAVSLIVKHSVYAAERPELVAPGQ